MSADASCTAPPIRGMYSTSFLGTQGSIAQRVEAWHSTACPWEEVRHSGYFNTYEETELATQYAVEHIPCAKRADRDRAEFARRMAGRRFFFAGDSVMRQYTEAFLCRLRASLRVVHDGMPWIRQWPSNQWGHCYANYSASGPHQGGLQHCFMKAGCVVFEGDVRVCYMLSQWCLPHVFLGDGIFKRMANNLFKEHGAGVQTYLVMTHGMHLQVGHMCDAYHWSRVKKLGPKHLQYMLRDAKVEPSKFSFVYKELDATHFPAKSGLYQHYAYNHNRSKWHCGPVNPGDPIPPMRRLELDHGLPAIENLRHAGVPVHILRTFEAGLADGPRLHATHASKPGSGNRSIDCLHWMMPGIPDVWVEQLLEAALK